jgi:hypothetical protein
MAKNALPAATSDSRKGTRLMMPTYMQTCYHQGKQKRCRKAWFQIAVIEQEPCLQAESNPARAGNPKQHNVVKSAARAASSLPPHASRIVVVA